MSEYSPNTRAPWWFAILLIIAAVPALWLEASAVHVMNDSGWLASDFTTWLYPAYVIISAFSAWFCYPTRRTLAWILFFLIILTDLALLIVPLNLK